MHLETIIEQLNQMRLTSMAKSLRKMYDTNEFAGLSPLEAIALITQVEFEARENRKLQRMLSRANFKPEQACLENIDYNSKRGITKSDLSSYAASLWIKQKKHLIITGPTGTGKTYISEAIGFRACILGYPAMKIRYSRIFDEINTAKGLGQYSKYIQKMEKMSVLIIDDFLNYKANTKELVEFMELIEDRDQRGPVIVTSQYPTTKWHERISDPTLADAICDRLISGTRQINLKGDSMRKKKR